MKTKIYLLISMFTVSSIFVFSSQDRGNTGDGGLTIDSVSLNASVSSVSVSVEGTNIRSFFASDLGLVDITVHDSDGFMVYSEWVNATSNSTHFIDTFGFSSGSYDIIYTNSAGVIIQKTTISID